MHTLLLLSLHASEQKSVSKVDFKGAVSKSNPMRFFGETPLISPHYSIAVHSAHAVKRNPVFIRSPGSINGKQTHGLDRAA